ncbi:unnamed protein product, partial [Meganyctiphanes norvegica]
VLNESFYLETQAKVQEQHVTKRSSDLDGNVKISEICYYSVDSKCDYESLGCCRLHANKHFHWQVSQDKKDWINLCLQLSDSLEQLYCQPENDTGILPAIDSNSNKKLICLFDRNPWRVIFHKMILTSPTREPLHLRRLCTEYMYGKQNSSNTFVWYFKGDKNTWTPYGRTKSSGGIQIDSEYIEKLYQQKFTIITFDNSVYNYTINFEEMTQINLKTKTKRAIVRRPKQHYLYENRSLNHYENLSLNHWAPMPNNNKKGFIRVDILSGSNEYQKVIGIINGGISNIEKIERIQNKFLWRALENKINEMTEVYDGTVARVNIQQLFHGTSINVIDAICAENFDPRLHGTATGQNFGQGAYFSPYSKVSDHYCKMDDLGNSYMFIARVAVGNTIQGNKQMARPPINPTTGRPYDSTVDNENNIKVIVKYDKQEFYPEYLITFQGSNQGCNCANCMIQKGGRKRKRGNSRKN